MTETLRPQPYRDANDHPYCTTECHCWRAQREQMPKLCIVRNATPQLMKELRGRICLPVLDEVIRENNISKLGPSRKDPAKCDVIYNDDLIDPADMENPGPPRHIKLTRRSECK